MSTVLAIPYTPTPGDIKASRLYFSARLLTQYPAVEQWLLHASARRIPIHSYRITGDERRFIRKELTVGRSEEKNAFRLNLGSGALADCVAGSPIILRFEGDDQIVVVPREPRLAHANHRGTSPGRARARREEPLGRAGTKAPRQGVEAGGVAADLAIRRRTPGSARGQVWMSDDFDEPLADFEALGE